MRICNSHQTNKISQPANDRSQESQKLMFMDGNCISFNNNNRIFLLCVHFFFSFFSSFSFSFRFFIYFFCLVFFARFCLFFSFYLRYAQNTIANVRKWVRQSVHSPLLCWPMADPIYNASLMLLLLRSNSSLLTQNVHFLAFVNMTASIPRVIVCNCVSFCCVTRHFFFLVALPPSFLNILSFVDVCTRDACRRTRI